MKKKYKNHLKIAILFSIGLLWITVLYDSFCLPTTFHLRYINPKHTSFMNYYDGKKDLKNQWVSLDNISIHIRNAVILAEDDTFFSHHGYNLQAIEEAIKVNWKKKRFARGASTITQQLAKNLFLSPKKTPFRKLKEFLIALKLDRELSKQRILELYLNLVEWGDGIYGIEAASKHYFGKKAAYLDKDEAAFLAAILPKPKYYEKKRDGSFLTNRRDIIRSRL